MANQLSESQFAQSLPRAVRRAWAREAQKELRVILSGDVDTIPDQFEVERPV